MATIITRAGKEAPLTNAEVDSNFTNLNDDKQEILAEGAFVDGDKTKLDGIEANADVTDTANVTSAGALMDSELTDIAAVKALDQGVATTDSPSFAGLTATTADINGGTIDGVTIGGASAGAGTFTTGQFNTSLNVDGTVTADGLTVAFGNSSLETSTSAGFDALSLTTSRSTGTGSVRLDTVTPTSNGSFVTYLATDTITQFGSSREDTTQLLHENGNGLVIGTINSTPVLFGTNSTERTRIDSSGTLIHKAAATFNDEEGDNDFQVKSDSNANCFIVNAGTDRVSVGNSSPTGKFEIYGANANDIMMRVNNSAYSSLDTSGDNKIQFGWSNHTGASIVAFKDGTVNRTGFKINTEVGFNTETERVKLGSDGSLTLTPDVSGDAVFNENSADADFQVKSVNNDNMLFVDAGNNRVSVGSNAPTARFYVIGANPGDNNTAARITGSTSYVSDGNWEGPLQLDWTQSSNDGSIRMLNIDITDDGSGNQSNYGVYVNGEDENFFSGNLDVRGSARFNENGGDNDFRVESDENANAFFLDASVGAGVIHFGGNRPLNYAETGGNGELAYLIDNGSSYGSLSICNNADRGWSMIYANKFAYSSGDDRRYINWYVNGSSLANLQLNAAGTQVEYNTGSDRRLKENIVDIDDGIVRLKQMQPRKYTWVGTDFPAEGFIADEADGVVPEAVKGEVGAVDDEGNPIYQQIEYSRYVPLLTAALQEAIAKIESLEARVAQLEAN